MRFLLRMCLVFVAVFAAAFWYVFFSPRPPNMTDPATLAGDGSLIDYCQLPELDGSGLKAADIPKGNTPGCRYSHFPLPILANCTEPLAEGVRDIRGLWIGVSGKVGHVERIEQCGSRTVVTSSGIIHDYGPNSTGVLNTNDTEGGVRFTLGGKPYCPRTSASMIWEDGILNFYAFGLTPLLAVRRYPDGDALVWEYVDGSITRMKRICQLPEEHKIPKPR